MDLEKEFQCEIARVKELKGVHTSRWVKVPVGAEDKLYLDDHINKLKVFGLSTACKLHESNVRLIRYLCYYENKDNI